MQGWPALVSFLRPAPVGWLLGASTLLAGGGAGPAAPTPLAATQAAASLPAGLGNGVNLQPSYYRGSRPDLGWALMRQQARIKTVRIEIEPGYERQAQGWIAQAKRNGYAIIATYHKSAVLGTDEVSELLAAARWWQANYAALGGGFTLNLINEWGGHRLTADAYARAYNQAIAMVRTVYGGPIIIDCPGYGQETAVAAAAAKGYHCTKISDTNVVLSVHIYPNGFNWALRHYLCRSDLDDLASAGRPCLIGEFGNTPAGLVYWQDLVRYGKSKGWPVLGWCWHGDGSGMNMVGHAHPRQGSASLALRPYFSQVYELL